MVDPPTSVQVAEPTGEPQTQVLTFLFVDIRGYTRFTLEQGDEAAARLASRFAVLAREGVVAHDGQLIELRGDEALATFSSARQALRAAVDLQVRFAAQVVATPGMPIPVGMGVDAGEAVAVEGGFRGSALNLASRLCALAGPGEVLASLGVAHLARKTEGLRYLERGQVELKGFDEPVPVVQVIADTGEGKGEAAGAAVVAPPAGKPLPIGGFLGSLPSGPIVAREDDLAPILAAIDTVAEGTGQVVIVAGQRGVGKTRLAQEATRIAHIGSFLIATGRCYQPEQTVAFNPFLEMLSMAYAAAPQSVRLQIPRRWPHLSLLVPEVSAAPTPTPSGDVAEEQQRVIRAVSGFLTAIAETRPLALLLDDLQWADEPSLRLLTHLARQTKGSRVLIVGTYCDAELRRDSPLDRALRELVRERLVERVALRRLTAEGTAAMVAATIGDMEMSEEFVEFVHRKSKGVPLFVEEMLRSLGGHFKLVREIGAGGMGRVFHAVDTRTGHAVAAKIMFASREAEADAALRFQQEGAVLASLQHPNIVRVHESFVEEHASCIIMELLKGSSLAEILRSDPPDLTRTKEIMRQVVSALASAHERGIVHRDIKPDNIMVESGDLVKVTDFGIARILRPTATIHTMTSVGMTLGTPLYMSPEQIDGRRPDGRADIYAVGAVLYQMVTGRPPFEASDPLTIAFKHVKEAPISPRKVRAGVPRDWEALIMKCLVKDPAGRFQTAEALEAAIAELSTDDTRKQAQMDSGLEGSELTPGAFRSLLRARTPTPGPYASAAGGVAGESAAAMSRPSVPLTPLQRMKHHATSWPGIAAAVVLVFGAGLLAVTRSRSSSQSATHALTAVWAAHAPGKFSSPNGVATDTRGDVFVADQITNRVQELSPTGEPLAQWGSTGSGRGQLNGAWGVALDRQNNVYVADTGNNRIQKFSPSGTFAAAWGQQGSGPAQFSSPYGVAVDSGGNIYVADEGNHRIQKLSKDGTFQKEWAHNFSFVEGLAVDPHDNLYAADAGNGNIGKLSAAGAFVPWGSAGTGAKRLTSASGIAVDGAGNVYVSDQSGNAIQKFSPDGAALARWGSRGSAPGQFNSPQGLAIGPAGTIDVADNANSRVQELSANGHPLASWKVTGQGIGLLGAPSGIAVDTHGSVYVADSLSNGGRIYRFTARGSPDPSWKPARATANPYQYAGISVTSSGDLYVADQLNSIVAHLSSTGRRLRTLAHATTSDRFFTPTGVAVDPQGSVYVVDTNRDRIVKFAPDGKVLKTWGKPGNGPLQFSAPVGIAVDTSGAVYVVDSTNNTVQKLSPEGAFIAQIGRTGSAPGQFNAPTAVAVDAKGNIYVADTGNHRVEEFSSDQSFVGQWGSKGSRPGQFLNPGGIAVDGSGTVYVADTGNHRIQVFGPRS